MTVGATVPRAPDVRGAPSRVDRMAREHYAPLLRFATQLTGSATEASDLVQDTFEKALRRGDVLGDLRNERAWLHSMLHNAFLDHCRRRAVRKNVGEDVLESQAAEPEAEPPAWASISSEELQRAIGLLEPEFRTVYTMRVVDNRSYKEIADALAIPMNTVGTRLARAREKLKESLVNFALHEDGTK